MVFHIDVYHRHAENVLSMVDITCGHIPAEIGHPKDASGRHCVLSLCHLMYCHLPNISPWRLRRFTKSHSKPNYHLSCHSSVHMHIQNHQTTCHRVVLSLTLRQIIPALHPLSSPPSVSGAPGQSCPQHPQQRPLQGAAPRRRRGR